MASSSYIVVLEAARSHRICSHSPGSAGILALPRHISCAGSCGSVGSSRYDMVEASTQLLGSTYLLLRGAVLELFITTDRHEGLDQPVRTMLDSRYELWEISP